MLIDFKQLLSKVIVPQLLCSVLVLMTLLQSIEGIRSIFLLAYQKPSPTPSPIRYRPSKNPVSLSASLFGTYVPQELNGAGVKQSLLDFTVVGILFSENPRKSHVIIRTATDREHTYYEGDILPGGAVIKRITNDGVLILRQGIVEGLSLPKETLIIEKPPNALNAPLRNGD